MDSKLKKKKIHNPFLDSSNNEEEHKKKSKI
jgi:hypothetical protein